MTAVTRLLEARSITKRFQGVVALDNVDLRLEEGKVHALVGHNGAGKSTLIGVLSGAISPDDGEIILDGRMVTFGSTSDALRNGISCIYQEMSIVPEVSIAENVYLGDLPARSALGTIRHRRMAKAAGALLATVGADLDPRRRARGLGVGQQQLIMIARALHRRSRVMIMDEPTASLNRLEVQALFDVIRSLKAAGQSILFVSHNMQEIFAIADEVTVLRDGKRISTQRISATSMTEVIERMGVRRSTAAASQPTTELGPPVLEVRHLRADLVKDINLTLREGEVVGLIGLLGSGRTELLRAIYGADGRSAGEILVQGNRVTIRSPSDAVRSGIGMLTEERRTGVIPQFSVRSNITLSRLRGVGSWLRLDPRRETKVALRYMRDLDIKASSPAVGVRKLSGGNQQKVIIAKWLHAGASVLLLDEPTKGIDVNAKQEILALLRSLSKDGVAIIIVSSELEDLVGICHRYLVLRKGHPIEELGPRTSVGELHQALANDPSPQTLDESRRLAIDDGD
ncbi:MAG: sugar ABC transporter ATP-binding protein [Candidatus Limnocylindria bacterium]